MVTAAVKADLIKVIRDSCVSFLKRNLISLKELRTFAGRAVHAASLLFGWLPFVRMLWGPLSESSSFGAPPGMVWVKQIMIPVKWILEFLNGARGTTSRSFTTEAYFGRAEEMTLTLDASPWGLGAILSHSNYPIEYFASKLTALDEEILAFEIGSSAAQQIVEALAVLVALRHWSGKWKLRRVLLRVRSDSMSALTSVMFCRAAGVGTAIVARELALDIAESIYRPDIGEHIPGVVNLAADALSRLFIPNGKYVIPTYLAGALCVFPPKRRRSFYRTVCAAEHMAE